MTTSATVRHLTTAELEAGLAHIRQAPRDHGVLALIVRRPAVDAREVLTTAELDPAQGLVGDTWRQRGSTRLACDSADRVDAVERDHSIDRTTGL